MPTSSRKKNKRNKKKGKGVKEFFENIGNKIKSGVKSVHNWMQDKKPISRVLDIPIIGWAIKWWPIGIPLWATSKIAGYGRSKKNNIKGGAILRGRPKKVGRPKKH